MSTSSSSTPSSPLTCLYCDRMHCPSRNVFVKAYETPQTWINKTRLHRFFQHLIPPWPLKPKTFTSACEKCYDSIRRRKYSGKILQKQIDVITHISHSQPRTHSVCICRYINVVQILSIFFYDGLSSTDVLSII
jgi:hypothetical protein